MAVNSGESPDWRMQPGSDCAFPPVRRLRLEWGMLRMKLLSFSHKGRSSYGAKVGECIIDLGKRFGDRWPTLGAALRANALSEFAGALSAKSDLALADVMLDPVITDPQKIICVGLNYQSHIQEMGREPPVHPALFTRFINSLGGSGSKIILPTVSERFDFEGEFACIIGKRARHVKAADAHSVIAGYTCFNDGSIRDWQNHTTQFTAGKNFPQSGAIGPWMVTRDELPDEGKLILQTRLNGETVQRAPLSDMVFGLPALIEYISTAIELMPGDIIATGTPSGVGAGRKPPLWMKAGDKVEVEIDGIGILANQVAVES